MDHERFKDISAGIQSIVVAVAIVIGGVWTAYTFGVLRSVEEAKAKIESLTAPSLSISIDTERVKSISTNRIGLIVRVRVENTGGQHVNLDLLQNPLKLVLVQAGNDGYLHAKKTYQPPLYRDIHSSSYDVSAAQTVEIRSKKTLSYFLEVEEPGLYFVRFMAPTGELAKGMPKARREEIEKAGLRYVGDHWVATTFVDLR